MNYQHILDRLPYKSSFRFVDEITELTANGVTGQYTLRPDAFFYEDHFPGNPVTPGAILTEIMAQIGLVVLGIFLATTEAGMAAAPKAVAPQAVAPKVAAEEAAAKEAAGQPFVTQAKVFPLLTSADVAFLKLVLPGQKVTVISRKVYFRFDKLKCNVIMQDEQGEAIAKGVFAGMIKQLTK